MTTVVWRLNPYTGSTVWTYGNYGGPGWTGGEFTPPDQQSKFAAPPADGTDRVFMVHDKAYGAAQDAYKASGHTRADQIAALRAIIKADEVMQASLKGIINGGSLNGTTEGREQGAAATEAYMLFHAKSVADKAKLALLGLGQDSNGINDINYNPMGDVNVISPTLGTTPDPLVKVIQYVDPLVLDLDGDGLEITPLSKGILFDANGDTLKTGTAWVGADDGLLVWDRNGNGSIDTGAELFGDETILSNGQKAAHGFAALSELDTGSVVNGITVGAGDGMFDDKDAQYATLRIWRDPNQDGISQTNELKTLAETGVASIKLSSDATRINYGDAVLAQSGSFTRTDGSAGQAGSFVLAQNNFSREFVPIVVSDAAKALPGLKGSGWVRDLREAGRVREYV